MSSFSSTPGPKTGFEFEGLLAMLPMLPQFRQQTADSWNTGTPHILDVLRASPAQGESGPAWNTLVVFTVVTAALKRAGLKAGIYQGALEELQQLLAQGGHAQESQQIANNLRDAGFVIEKYAQDMFCVGSDPSTYASTSWNITHFTRNIEDYPDQKRLPFAFDQFSGFEINGPVFASPEAMADAFEQMIHALRPLGLLMPETCGIHQHIDIGGLTYGQFINVMRIHAFCDAALRQAVFPPHRRDSRFCRPLDYYFIPDGIYTPLEQLSLRLDSLCQEYDRAYAKSGLPQEQLLKKIAADIQANIFPSGLVNESFYWLTEITTAAMGNGNRVQIAEMEDLALDLRRQRYFDPSPESPDKHGTAERRWMPSTDDPELVRAWFILNHTLVKRAQNCSSSEILYDSKTQKHSLVLVDTSGKLHLYGDSLPEVLRFLDLPPEVNLTKVLADAQDPQKWGYDLAEDPCNSGLWRQAKVADASLHSNHPALGTAREGIYDDALEALLAHETARRGCNVIQMYCAAMERTAVNS